MVEGEIHGAVTAAVWVVSEAEHILGFQEHFLNEKVLVLWSDLSRLYQISHAA